MTKSGPKVPVRVSVVITGVLVMLFWALYGVAINRLIPLPDHVQNAVKVRVAVEVAALMSLLVVLEGEVVRRLLSARSESRFYQNSLVERLKQRKHDLVALGLVTALGPPLWIFAVMWINAQAANWIDLGSAPLFTVALAAIFSKESRRIDRFGYASLACLAVGLAVMAWRPILSTQQLKLVGVALALVSGLATAMAAGIISRLSPNPKHDLEERAKSATFQPLELVVCRYVVPTVVLIAGAAFVSLRGGAGGLWQVCGPKGVLLLILFGTLFNVLPNVFYIRVVKSSGWGSAGYLWALLPVFTSVVAVTSGMGTAHTGLELVVGGVLLIAGYVFNEIADARAAAPAALATVQTAVAASRLRACGDTDSVVSRSDLPPERKDDALPEEERATRIEPRRRG